MNAGSSRTVDEILASFAFPADANCSISDETVRRVIWEAYGRKCFYSERTIQFSELAIDHVIPVSRGGPDNFYNFVPTTRRHNMAKHAKFDPVAAIGTLSIIRTVYAPRILRGLTLQRRRGDVVEPREPKPRHVDAIALIRNGGIVSWPMLRWDPLSTPSTNFWKVAFDLVREGTPSATPQEHGGYAICLSNERWQSILELESISDEDDVFFCLNRESAVRYVYDTSKGESIEVRGWLIGSAYNVGRKAQLAHAGVDYIRNESTVVSINAVALDIMKEACNSSEYIEILRRGWAFDTGSRLKAHHEFCDASAPRPRARKAGVSPTAVR